MRGDGIYRRLLIPLFGISAILVAQNFRRRGRRGPRARNGTGAGSGSGKKELVDRVGGVDLGFPCRDNG